MRIYLKTTPNSEIVDFNYQQKLVGVIHKWIGKNNDSHGKMSLYSFSWLLNGRMKDRGLTFVNGAQFFISAYDEEFIRKILKSLLEDPLMFYGMSVCEVSLQSDPDMTNRENFNLASPIYLHYTDKSDGKNKHFTFEDPDRTSLLMTEILKKKMKIAGLELDDSLNVRFDLSYSGKKTKLITYKGVCIRTSMCPIIIEGLPASKQFAWNVGIGNSTGIGFGAIL